jgi:DNA-binding MarR family transcriptional regulator
MSEPQPDSTPQDAMFVERPDGLRHPSAVHAGAFLGLVRAGHTLDRNLDAELRAGHGLSLRGFEVLLHLAVFSPNGQLRMTQLAAQTPLSQSRVSRLVAELESQRLVARSTDEDDSRAVTVTVTDRGLEQLRQAQDTHYEGLRRRLFSCLSTDEVKQLGELTAKILRANDQDDR